MGNHGKSWENQNVDEGFFRCSMHLWISTETPDFWRKRAGCLAAGEGRIFGKCGSPGGCSQRQEGGAPEQLKRDPYPLKNEI